MAAKLPLGTLPPFCWAVLLWMRDASAGVIGVDLGADLDMLSLPMLRVWVAANGSSHSAGMKKGRFCAAAWLALVVRQCWGALRLLQPMLSVFQL